MQEKTEPGEQQLQVMPGKAESCVSLKEEQTPFQ